MAKDKGPLPSHSVELSMTVRAEFSDDNKITCFDDDTSIPLVSVGWRGKEYPGGDDLPPEAFDTGEEIHVMCGPTLNGQWAGYDVCDDGGYAMTDYLHTWGGY